MGLDDALIFTRVVEYHSFTQAAQSLGMQKSTVSRRIALLEERLGVRLLNRTTRKLRLTEVGQAYYERCRQIMHDFAEAEQAVMQLQQAPSGLLRITSPIEFGQMFLASLLGDFMRQYPQITAEVELASRSVDPLQEGVDIVIMVGQPEDSTLVARRLLSTSRWLTENFGWEYIFYINVPPGLLMIAGLLYGLEKKAPHWELLKSTDYAGIVTLGIGLGCLQVFLEEGHRKDWLESQLIVSLGSVALFSLVLFVILQLSRPNPLIDLGILRNRNFGLASISSIGLGMGLYGSIYVLPLYLAQIQGYNAMQIGEVIMWMGIPQLFLIPLVPKLMKLVSPRLLCAAGFGLFGLASFFSGVLNPDFAGPQFNQIQLLRALGQPMIMVTISLIATAYLQPQDAGSASSLFNILRNLGGAIGIALLATLLDSRAKVYFDYLREALVPTNPQVDERLAQLAAQLGSQQAALGKLSEITHQQAMIMAYNDAFHVIGMVLAVSMLAVLLTRSLPAGIGARADAGAH